ITSLDTSLGSLSGTVTGAINSIAGNTTAITNLTNGVIGLVKQDATTRAITVAADTGGSSVSVGGTGGSRTLTGVTAGALSATSTDAVNGSQLAATNTSVDNLGSSTAAALGGGAAYDSSTGTLTAPSYTIQGTTYG
ncbi:hypothetical protein GW721_24365, partial [Citrobacter braakii]|nr:hypothetical protein [Citrobacter braakii]